MIMIHNVLFFFKRLHIETNTRNTCVCKHIFILSHELTNPFILFFHVHVVNLQLDWFIITLTNKLFPLVIYGYQHPSFEWICHGLGYFGDTFGNIMA